jgi:hypothetical protein
MQKRQDGNTEGKNRAGRTKKEWKNLIMRRESKMKVLTNLSQGFDIEIHGVTGGEASATGKTEL